MIWTILIFILYTVIGCILCSKFDMLLDGDVLDDIVNGVIVAFWPFIILFNFLLKL